MERLVLCLRDEHDLRLVGVAAIVCVLTGLVAADLLQRGEAAEKQTGRWWIGASAFVIGTGIWATHFIAMMGFEPGPAIAFNAGATILSWLAGIATAAAGLIIAVTPPKSAEARWIGGAVIGAGVAILHYIGLAALSIFDSLGWDWSLVGVSILVSIVGQAIWIGLAARTGTWLRRLRATLTFTAAVCLLHLIGVAAANLPAKDALLPLAGDQVGNGLIAAGTAVSMLLILGIGALGLTVDRILMSRALRHARRLKELADTAFEGIAVWQAGRITEANASLCGLLGLPRDRVVGASLETVVSAEDMPSLLAHLAGRNPKPFLIALATADGTSLPVEIVARGIDDKEGSSCILTFRDLSERIAAEAKIRQMAHFDALTGLANRSLFQARLQEEIVSAERRHERIAVHYIDLDRFKQTNDTYGHAAGDALLREVGRRLDRLASTGGLAARLAGDEFVIVQTGLGSPDVAVAMADRIVREIQAFVTYGSAVLRPSCSVGVAIYPTDGLSSDDLLRHADVALYRAKSDGRGSFRTFDPEMEEEIRKRGALAKELGSALHRGELRVVYQPQVISTSRALRGYEALARWTHPVLGAVSPATFIPIAEQAGLIGEIGEFVLREACATAAAWTEPHLVAVNLSAAQILQDDVPSLVERVLRETGLSPRQLELEITETVLLNDKDLALGVLARLKKLGVRVAMDDFGTGYSSLSYLQTFPFDKIKIDRSFVQDIETNPYSRAIVRAVIGLARSLSINVVAEGVETEEQFAILASEHCDTIQGFLTGRPQELEAPAASAAIAA